VNSEIEVTLILNISEVNGILQTLGQLPTSSGAFPLMQKIKAQAEDFVQSQPQPAKAE
jgi:hypothetical protein